MIVIFSVILQYIWKNFSRENTRKFYQKHTVNTKQNRIGCDKIQTINLSARGALHDEPEYGGLAAKCHKGGK
ncbi:MULTISPECIES: hypothetical protein [Oscillospiraceae]|uniref:hypothetical protein n=1 Tax=Oscillospiraceae TaxID=216572 RepID=UPI0010468F8A|nr:MULTISPECIES: hypothetical protein [Oscillospiraceae]